MAVNIPIARGDYFRAVAKEARIITKNRYYEANPILTKESQVAMIARMGLVRGVYIGDGPIRATYTQPGSFKDCVFSVSGEELYRVDVDLAPTFIGNGLTGLSPRGFVSMAATGNIGNTPEYLFVADGRILMLYIANGFATGVLSGTPANGNVVRVDLVYYQFTNGSVNAGTPAGTLANPWLVALGASSDEAFANLADAFEEDGTPGTTYSVNLVKNALIEVASTSSNTVSVRATASGALGNAVVTTETGAALAWTQGGTLTGGGDPSWSQVETPDDVGIISVGYIGSHIIAVPAQGQGINGRFYWIRPGETTIDPLDFATAERAPDPAHGVVVFGDQFWLPGSTTVEPWFMTGDINAPVMRMQGVVFDRGTWAGTAVQVKDKMIIVDPDGGVFMIGQGIVPISRPDISERIREAIQYQASQTL